MSKRLLVLAGGFGTRLKSVVADRPKPLAIVAGKPFLEHLILSWVNSGQRNFVFLLHHRADQIIAFLKSQENSLLRDCTYSILTEVEPLGTGGAVSNAVHELEMEGSFLVANADTWLGDDSLDVMSKSEANCMAVVKVPNMGRYGSVCFDRNGLVSGFIEKQNTSGSGWINAGMYLLSADLFKSWNGEVFSLESTMFPRLVAKNQLRAVPLRTSFIDIGIPEDYQRFQDWITHKEEILYES